MAPSRHTLSNLVSLELCNHRNLNHEEVFMDPAVLFPFSDNSTLINMRSKCFIAKKEKWTTKNGNMFSVCPALICCTLKSWNTDPFNPPESGEKTTYEAGSQGCQGGKIG